MTDCERVTQRYQRVPTLPPAFAGQALDLHEDLPAGLVVVKELLTHLLAVQGLQDGLEQRGEGLQATGQRSG